MKVKRWIERDSEGLIYGYPSDVEIDLVIKDRKIILIEVSSHVKASDALLFRGKPSSMRGLRRRERMD